MKVAAIQHDIAWEDADGDTRARRPDDRQGGGRRRAARSCCRRCSRPASPCARSGSPRTRAARPSSSCSTRPPSTTRTLIASIAQRGADGRYRNNAVVAGPDGLRGRYAKIHPFSYAGEHERYAAGDRFLTVDVDGLRVRVFVCYDLRFADEFWARALETDLYVVPANWPAAAARALARAAASPGRSRTRPT